jgi:circadian clock protein KaiC
MKGPAKAPTGITGLDEITGGGLPSARTTLLMGGPGSGKTILALKFLMHGARDCREPGIFVAFEEASKRIVANAETFGWKLAELRRRKLFFLDARPTIDLVRSGDFDLGGMLAALDAQIGKMKARRIVFDALDIVLDLLPDAAAKRREVYRLHEWLLARELTGVITLQTGGDETDIIGHQPFGFMQFMVDCVVILHRSVMLGVSQRKLRVQKYRGSSFDENELPFVIGKNGLEITLTRAPDGMGNANVTNERVSSGVERLDTMLGGGYYRGASVLITGLPGAAKTTLSGAFAEAACERGERTLFVSFDSDCAEVVRNLGSVGIRLQRHVKSGLLCMISARTVTGSAETYLMRIKTLATEHKARCLVIDPVSTWSKAGNDSTMHSVVERLFDWTKAVGITLLCTHLIEEMTSRTGGSSGRTSTLVDTWIHLDYLVQAGERNRGLSVIKSRGTAHSNQVRELILSDAGVTLADTYTADGGVLMGTQRWEKESAMRVASEGTEIAGKLKRVRLEAEEAELEARLKSLQTELAAKQVEKALLARTTASRRGELSRGRTRMRELRGADAAVTRTK